jgi:serine/threonine protein kinase
MLRDSTDFSSCCIVDFGLADYWNVDGNYTYTRCGTPGFVAPELL